jgi:hypothetical protein
MTLMKRNDRKLTTAEKQFARKFLEAAQIRLTVSMQEDPPTYSPPNFSAIFRHKCKARLHQESTALELKEIYVFSEDPIGLVEEPPQEPVWLGHEAENVEFVRQFPGHVDFYNREVGLPLFGFIYREGKCKGCGDTARSPAGRLVLQEERPPAQGRMARD